MNDWMLTDDGTRAWARDAFWETTDSEWPNVNTIADCVIDEVARAAVKKVVEWLEEDCTEHTPPLYAATYPVDRASCAECWAALKAAGEGK